MPYQNKILSGLYKESKTKYSLDSVCGQPAGNLQEIYISGYQLEIHIKGWAIDSLSKDLAGAVYVQIDDTLYKTNYGTIRYDAANRLNDDKYLKCGFDLTIPKSLIEDGRHSFSLKIIAKDNKHYFSENETMLNLAGYSYWIEESPVDSDDLKKIVREKDSDIANLYSLLQTRDNRINDLQKSLSWRITYPLRKIVDFFLFLKKVFSQSIIIIRNEGLSVFFKKAKLFIVHGADIFSGDDIYRNYAQFLQLNKPGQNEISKIKEECKDFDYKPSISIITPVYNVDPKWLNKCIQSVVDQYYKNWELCLYDDASTNKNTIDCLENWQNVDKRIKVKLGTENQNISGASNESIKMATGEFIGLLDNDDELTPDALHQVVKALNKDKNIDFLYSDEDKLEMNGLYSGPYFKPDFNPDLFLSNNYLCHFSVIRKSIGDKINWFRKGYEGSQDYDLFLRVYDQTSKIHHIPKVLYHWRKIPGSTASVYDNKSYANLASVNALTDYMKRNNIEGEVINGLWPGAFRIKRNIAKKSLVSIIIPFKDKVELLRGCIQSIIRKTDYKNYEIILISNNSTEKKTFDYVNEIVKSNVNISFFEYNVEFNFSKINNWAAQKAKGEYLLFLNNDTEVISNEWLSAMVEHAQRDDIGAVGARLLFSDNTIQHAGVLLGVGGIANHAFWRKNTNDNCYWGNINITRNYSACTAACLLIRKSLYEKVGGMDEKNLKIAFNDVDLSLKLINEGYRIVYTPYATLYHHESLSRGYEISKENKDRLDKESEFIMSKWGEIIKNDPYYNPNLTREKPDFNLKMGI